MRTMLAAALLAIAVTLTACGSSNPTSAAAQRVCKVAQLEVKDMGSGAVNAQAMTTYATSLADTGVTGELAGPVGHAITAGNDAANDAATDAWEQYKADAAAFVSDLEMIGGDCRHGIS